MLVVETASAYDWKTHSRIVEVAVKAMQSGKGAPPAPAGVDPVEWGPYAAAISAAADRLTDLNTGVGNPGREKPDHCHYDNASSSSTSRPNGDKRDNMAQVPFTRIRDMNYLQIRGHQKPATGTDPAELVANSADSDADCSQIPRTTPDGLNSCPGGTNDDNFDALRLGKVLGWQSGSVDEHIEDVQLWDRPTSSAIVDMASTVLLNPLGVPLIVAGAVVVLLECFWDWISDSGDCGRQFEKAVNMLDDASPAKIIAGDWLPGIDIGRSDSYTGLWHFIDVADFSGKTDDFNPNAPNLGRGMLYEEAGPDGAPGAFDMIIALGGGDLLGLGLDPDNSAGVAKYAPYDDSQHEHYDWVAPTLGHVEFSPVTHLAQYGYDAFLQNPTSAINLGYPLHAIGDAAEPHHVAGTTAWGHRPYEDLVDQNIDREHFLFADDTGFLAPPQSCALRLSGWDDKDARITDAGEMTKSLIKGLEFWKAHKLDQAFPAALIQDLARQTYVFAHAAPGKTVYNDDASTTYLFFDEPGGVSQYTPPLGTDSEQEVKTMLELGVGATIAFLTVAADHVRDPGENPNARCPVGTTYQIGVDGIGACSSGQGTPAPPATTNALSLGNGIGGSNGGGGAGSGGGAGTGGTGNCGVAPPCATPADCGAGFVCQNGCCAENPR